MNSRENHLSIEVRTLVDRMVDGTATSDDCHRLSTLVASDADARAEYLEYIELHGRLAWALSFPEPASAIDLLDGHTELDLLPNSAATDLAPVTPQTKTGRSAVLGFLNDCTHQASQFVRQPTPLSITVALLVVGSLLIGLSSIYLQHDQVTATVDSPEPVHTAQIATIASITRTIAAQWAPGQRPRNVGTKLTNASRLELTEGMAEVTFKSGARVILQAPAVIGLDTINSGYISSGRITAFVPPGAEGFSMRSPAATVVDLGTQFGLHVDRSNASLIHVFEGLVEVENTALDGKKTAARKLTAGESLRIHFSGQIDLDVTGEKQFATVKQFDKAADNLPITAGLALWLRADQGLVRDAENRVVEWNDQSPNRYQFKPLGPRRVGSSVPGPLVVDHGMNQKPVVRFDGNSGVLASTSEIQLFDSPSSSLTMIVVFRSNQTEGQKFVLSQTSTSSNDKIQLGYDVGRKHGSGNFGLHRGSTRATVAPAGTIINDETSLLTTIVLPGGLAPGNIQIFKNGESVAPLSADGGASPQNAGWYNAGSYAAFPAPLLVGGRQPSADHAHLDGIHQGDIAEVVIYRRALPRKERRAVERFLAKKWLVVVE